MPGCRRMFRLFIGYSHWSHCRIACRACRCSGQTRKPHMSNKWRVIDKPISVLEAECETDRLFDRPPRPISAATRALFRRVLEGMHREKAHRTIANQPAVDTALGHGGDMS